MSPFVPALRTARFTVSIALAALAFAGAITATSPAAADAPLPPPSRATECSANKRFCVDLDPATDTTTAYEMIAGKRGKTLWTAPVYYRSGLLANDGRTFFGLTTTMVWKAAPDPLHEEIGALYRDGTELRTFRAADVASSVKQMTETVSHYIWGSPVGFDASGNLVLQTNTGRRIRFDGATGKTLP